MPYIIHHYNGSAISHFFLEDQLTIGRKDSNDIQIDDSTLSGEHALIERIAERGAKGNFQVRDLESTNGVLYKGQKVKVKKLVDGDSIVVGTHDMEFVEELPEVLASTTKIKKSWIPGVYYTEQ